MQRLPIHKYFPTASRLIYGCMGLGGDWNSSFVTKEAVAQAHDAIDAALEVGINFFDHADIYSTGKAEIVFGEVFRQRPNLRDHMILQTKCGIRFEDANAPQRYDFSKEWIVKSVEGSLSRLGVGHIDILELHRPDPLMEPEEISAAFSALFEQGKVKHFGVSNMTGHQIGFLQRFLPFPLISNQLEMSLAAHHFVDDGIWGVHPDGADVNFTAGTLEYCRGMGVQLQSWGSLAKGIYSGAEVTGNVSAIQNTKLRVAKLAEKYQAPPESIVLSWLLRNPLDIQPVIGTKDPNRIIACAKAEEIYLTRDEWYDLYVAARGHRLP